MTDCAADPASDLVIRPATERDLDAIDAIEQHSFKSPWSRATFESELRRAWARIDVACRAARVVGFCNYWVVLPARAALAGEDPDGELHILAIATDPDLRRQGVAGRLLTHALDAAARAGCRLATLEVRRSNAPAIGLYERTGFRTVHVRKGYYQADGEDALVMLRDLTAPSP